VYNLDDLNEHKYVLVRLTSAASQLTHGFSYTPAKVRLRLRLRLRLRVRARNGFG
jgi:hypothetical protein